MTDLRERVARAICGAHTCSEGTWSFFGPEADAAIAAILPPRWMPIETAPRDGTDVLLFGPAPYGRPRPPLVAGWYDKGVIPGWYSYDEIEAELDMAPTHWMSLPPAPSPAPQTPPATEFPHA